MSREIFTAKDALGAVSSSSATTNMQTAPSSDPILYSTFPDSVEAAASIVHEEWMKRNPKAEWNAAQHVPYDKLPESEKQKDRAHVKTILSLIASAREQFPSLLHPLSSAQVESSIVDQFGSLAHEEWRKGLAASGHIGPRMKKTSDGSQVDINVPWTSLHPEWKRENLSAGAAAIDAVCAAFGFLRVAPPSSSVAPDTSSMPDQSAAANAAYRLGGEAIVVQEQKSSLNGMTVNQILDLDVEALAVKIDHHHCQTKRSILVRFITKCHHRVFISLSTLILIVLLLSSFFLIFSPLSLIFSLIFSLVLP